MTEDMDLHALAGLDGLLLGCRVSILLARREAGEPTGTDDMDELVALEEAALGKATRITAFLGRMADPDGDAFAQGLGWESAAYLKYYLDHGLLGPDG